MSEEQAALVRYRLSEAKETLEEARLLAREVQMARSLESGVFRHVLRHTGTFSSQAVGIFPSFRSHRIVSP